MTPYRLNSASRWSVNQLDRRNSMTIAKLRAAGRDALVLGAILFGYLIVGGGLANWLIQRAFSSASVFSS